MFWNKLNTVFKKCLNPSFDTKFNNTSFKAGFGESKQ